MAIQRVFYAAAGPADLIAAHHDHVAETHHPSEVSLTFSSQIEEFCADHGASAYFVSVHPDGRRYQDDRITIEHRPKRRSGGLKYHVEEVRYGLALLRLARRFKADVALLDSGITHYFVMMLFKLSGIPVVPILHNTLWPAGFRPRGPAARVIERLDRPFWRNGPLAVIGVSPECVRQVRELVADPPYPLLECRAQFAPDYFASIPPAPPHARRPFTVMFIGRIDRIKGVLDIPRMARWVEDHSSGLVRWIICGRGRDQEELAAAVQAERVGEVVELKGWTSLEELRDVYARSHAAIVPTRSSFAEGLAMTAAEAILAGRPLISNPVVPALELLQDAALSGRTDDPASHAAAVLTLAQDEELYERLRGHCAALSEQFYDRRQGLRQTLHLAVDRLLEEKPGIAA